MIIMICLHYYSVNSLLFCASQRRVEGTVTLPHWGMGSQATPERRSLKEPPAQVGSQGRNKLHRPLNRMRASQSAMAPETAAAPESLCCQWPAAASFSLACWALVAEGLSSGSFTHNILPGEAAIAIQSWVLYPYTMGQLIVGHWWWYPGLCSPADWLFLQNLFLLSHDLTCPTSDGVYDVRYGAGGPDLAEMAWQSKGGWPVEPVLMMHLLLL